jgi:molybdate transport system substrate-binding protein
VSKGLLVIVLGTDLPIGRLSMPGADFLSVIFVVLISIFHKPLINDSNRAMVTSMSVSISEIHVMSGGAPKEVFSLLTPKFEQQTGKTVKITYAVITALREKLAAGEKADVLVLPAPLLDAFAMDGRVRADSCSTFGTVGVSVVVKEGTPPPDISSREKFREAMLTARSVVHATPGKTPSGTHMGKVMEQLGIADVMAKRVILRPALDGGAQLVAAGQADIGIYPASEVARVKGLTIVGPLPAGIDFVIVYGGGVAADSAAHDTATAFVKFMAAPVNRTVWKEAGFEPLPS